MASADKNRIVIVGCGPGAPEFLTEAARDAIRHAEVLVGSRRLLDSFGSSEIEKIQAGSRMEEILAAIESRRATKRIVVLVSGDPGICSLAQPILRRFGTNSCRVIPGISSVQLACARLGLDWTNARILSAHRSLPAVSPTELASREVIAILSGHRNSHGWILDLIHTLGQDRQLVVCRNLSLPGERVDFVTQEEFGRNPPKELAVVLILKKGIP